MGEQKARETDQRMWVTIFPRVHTAINTQLDFFLAGNFKIELDTNNKYHI